MKPYSEFTGSALLISFFLWGPFFPPSMPGVVAQGSADSGDLDIGVVTDGSVAAFAVQPDRRVLVAGGFRHVNSEPLGSLIRLHPNGAIDRSFNPQAQGGTSSIAIQEDGKILVAGFRELAGEDRKYIGRLNPDGSLDKSFTPQISSGIRVVAVQADKKILMAGHFSIEGRRYLARLNPDGTLDPNFTVTLDDLVYSMLLQEDGKILIGGSFTVIDGQNRQGIGRLHSDGTLDEGFQAMTDHRVYRMALLGDGRILVISETVVDSKRIVYVDRLNTDGALDPRFHQETDNYVFSLLPQMDGKVLLGGFFTSVDGVPARHIARLNADGSFDPSFSARSYWGVGQLALQPDGKILVGRSLSTVATTDDDFFLRLHNTDPATQSLTVDDSALTWMRGGTAPEVWRTTFEHSDDGETWTMLGAGSRIEGGWELTNVDVPESGEIRARGFVQAANSSWFVETIVPLGLTAPLLKATWAHGDLRLTVYGDVGTGYAIESSNQLGMNEDWRTLTEEAMPSNPWEIVDGDGEGSSSRFYRVRKVVAE